MIKYLNEQEQTEQDEENGVNQVSEPTATKVKRDWKVQAVVAATVIAAAGGGYYLGRRMAGAKQPALVAEPVAEPVGFEV